YRNHLFPGRAPRVMDLRATDDRFIVAIDANDNTDHEQIESLLKEAGAVEVEYNERKYGSDEEDEVSWRDRRSRSNRGCGGFLRRGDNAEYGLGIFAKYV